MGARVSIKNKGLKFIGLGSDGIDLLAGMFHKDVISLLIYGRSFKMGAHTGFPSFIFKVKLWQSFTLNNLQRALNEQDDGG